MSSRRAVLALAPAAFGSMLLASGAAQAQAPAGARGAQAINATVSRGEHIRSVTAVTEVFGRSQRSTAAIVEYDAPIANDGTGAESWTVAGRTITRASANDRAGKAAQGRDGRFVILELDPGDEGATVFAPGVEEPATVVVSQAGPVATVSGAVLAPTPTAIINTGQ